MALAAVCGFLRFALGFRYSNINIFFALGLGTVAMLGMYFLDISRLAKYSLRFYVCTVILCISLAWADQQYFLSFFSPFWHSLFFIRGIIFFRWSMRSGSTGAGTTLDRTGPVPLG